MATLFPFPANWSAGVQVTLRFRTDVFVSRSGKEQRRALHTDPRKSISYSALAHAGNYRTFMRLMADSQNDDIILPDPTRSIGVTAAISSGATSFTVAGTRPYWITSGSTVILDDGENRATATVSGVSSSTITIGATTRAWPSHTLVRPALTGLLAPSIPSKMSTDNLANINVEFTVAPGSETYTTTSPVTTLEGVEVFTWPGQSESDILADWILAKLGRMRSKLGPSRKDTADGDGDKEARFAVLGTKAPAVLVEMGFISHPATEEQLRKPEVLHEIAFNICDAITCWRLTGKGPNT